MIIRCAENGYDADVEHVDWFVRKSFDLERVAVFNSLKEFLKRT